MRRSRAAQRVALLQICPLGVDCLMQDVDQEHKAALLHLPQWWAALFRSPARLVRADRGYRVFVPAQQGRQPVQLALYGAACAALFASMRVAGSATRVGASVTWFFVKLTPFITLHASVVSSIAALHCSVSGASLTEAHEAFPEAAPKNLDCTPTTVPFTTDASIHCNVDIGCDRSAARHASAKLRN
jgi:hypothetical protein